MRNFNVNIMISGSKILVGFLLSALILVVLPTQASHNSCKELFEGSNEDLASIKQNLIDDLNKLNLQIVLGTWGTAESESGADVATSAMVNLVSKVFNTGRQALDMQNAIYEETTFNDASSPNALWILPTGSSPLNLLAKKLEEKYGIRVGFYPNKLFEFNSSAFYSPYTVGPLDPRRFAIFIGPNSIAKGLMGINFLRDDDILHELMHFKTRMLLVQKATSSYYGEVLATEGGQIPDDKNPDLIGYRYKLHFDELRTYHGTIKLVLTKLRSVVTSGASDADVRTAIDSFRSYLRIGWTIARRSQLSSKLLMNHLRAASEPKISYAVAWEGVVTAFVFEKIRTESGGLYFEFPLVRANKADDPDNFGILLDQIQALINVSDKIFDQFAFVGTLTNHLDFEIPSRAELLELIDRCHMALPIVK